MSAIDNAVSLMESVSLQNKVKATSVYVARNVVTEAGTVNEHTRRLKLATAVVWNPQQYNMLLLNIVACDPEVCSATGNGDAISDAVLIQKVTDLWTPVSVMLFPTL